ncbi:MAG: hypothetical protein BWY01_01296 [Synergistetes bacterium ADurb.Bin155]|nr:MAG: hypothetical protein BWY01_01296 [Synergistetes bacterium ADurb.Bin155]
MQSIFPVFSSCSFAFQSIGCGTSWIPSRRHASRATSMSKPTISLFSSRNPIGGNASSSPSTSAFFSMTFCSDKSPAGLSFAAAFSGAGVTFFQATLAAAAMTAAERYSPGEYDNLLVQAAGAVTMVLSARSLG